MARTQDDSLPSWTWPLLGASAVALLLIAVAGISLISAGVFDPQPVGALQQALQPGARSVGAGESQVAWLDPPLPQAPFTARLLAAHASGEDDVGYGLALGSADENLVVAVSPLGYVAVWQEDGGAGRRTAHMPWQTWPHVRRGDAANEIQLDFAGGTASVRLNRELLWQGAWSAPEGAAVGLYLESFGGATTVDFDDLALYYDAAP